MSHLLLFTALIFSNPSFAKDSVPFRIAIVDSGINDQLPHLTFVKPMDLTKTSTKDELGHGSSVTTVVKEDLNKSIEVYSIKVLTKHNCANCLKNERDGYYVKDYGMPEVVEIAIKENIRVINMSLSVEKDSPEFIKAIKKAQSHGILIVTAAGNNFNPRLDEEPNYPCSFKLKFNNVICISGYMFDGDDQPIIGMGSNHGKKTTSYWARNTNIGTKDLKGLYVLKDGTSFAAPQFTNLISNEWAKNPKLTYKKVLKLIEKKLQKSEYLEKNGSTGLYLKREGVL